MKACIFQPPYSRDLSFSDEFFDYKMKLLDECDESIDIIVLPEYSDVPCATSTLEETLYYHNKYIKPLLDKCVKTAKRCRSLVFVNALSLEEGGYRNTTYAYDRKGELVGKYFKKHLPPLEMEILELDSDYTFGFSEPYTIDIEGLRYGFLTCYDFYFYEAFANIARENVDIIIGCSLQRSDSHDAIETMCRFLAYNTNAYVLRSSVSFDPDSDICGASMAVSPTGKVLANMKGDFGAAVVEFDPHDKYLKPAGYGNPDAAHYEYIEYGRKPAQYRNGGPSVAVEDRYSPYPRLSALSGVAEIAKTNLLAAVGAAAGMDVDEIAVLLTQNENTPVCLNRFGGSVTLSELLLKFSGRVIINAFVDDPAVLKAALPVIKKYDAKKHFYFTAGNDSAAKELALLKESFSLVIKAGDDIDEALKNSVLQAAKSVTVPTEMLSESVVAKVHGAGLRISTFADTKESAKRLIAKGADTVTVENFTL